MEDIQVNTDPTDTPQPAYSYRNQAPYVIIILTVQERDDMRLPEASTRTTRSSALTQLGAFILDVYKYDQFVHSHDTYIIHFEGRNQAQERSTREYLQALKHSTTSPHPGSSPRTRNGKLPLGLLWRRRWRWQQQQQT